MTRARASIRVPVYACAAFASLSTAASAATQAEPCWSRTPSGIDSVDYRHELASGGLLPETIEIGGRLIAVGVPLANIDAILGESAQITGPEKFEVDGLCSQLRLMLGEHPNSLYLYTLADVQRRSPGEWHGVSRWTIADAGDLAVYWHAAAPAGRRLVYLLEFYPAPVARTEVRWTGQRLRREGPRAMTWDIRRNRLIVSR